MIKLKNGLNGDKVKIVDAREKGFMKSIFVDVMLTI